ncbi:DUF4230 domain-containing protein [Cellulophaga baltica]|jgi:hypothetical protein|uniref:DUF4230 domain-containing protein n=1 Tax=Cellulophaga baltica TaxID=76594 RepID=A0A1G7GS41_9FLAO|nr:DUF4230 domain-containing protein [Cellulophaga baltica]MCR1025488.1 DUF4230 domain-containing protein [Cellulophaga baltica]WFO15556.1 DUF4230 domain-containing protein [Cellulophaga baltica 4]SDE90967.1 Protein of unknown function [Cellulophaga baltica]
MKNIIIGAVVTLALVFIFRSCSDSSKEKSILKENSMLIQESIKNVSKLVVTEGHFAEVYNYKDSQQLFGPLITAEKKALVVVNADVTVAYDLSKIDFEVQEETKTLLIKSIPEPEIKLNPDFEYYDVTADYLNQFNANDYNKIKKNVRASLMKKVENSALKTNAQNRLLSELSNFYILTNSLGWTLEYKGETVNGNLPDLIKG